MLEVRAIGFYVLLNEEAGRPLSPIPSWLMHPIFTTYCTLRVS